MFQTDDWEIGEDFLDDFLPKDEQSNKKKSDFGEKENSPKKRKSDSENKSLLLPLPEEKIPESKSETKDSSRRNKILKIYTASKNQDFENADQENPGNLSQTNPENPETSNQQNSKVNQTFRRKKVLQILRKASSNSSDIRKSEEPKSPEISRESQNNVENPVENLTTSREEARWNLMDIFIKRSKKAESVKENSLKNLSRENLVRNFLKKSSERSQNLNATHEIQEPEELNISSPQINDFPKPRRSVSFLNEIDEKTTRRKKLILDTLKKGSKNAESRMLNSSKNDESTSNNDSRSRNDSKSSTRTTKQVITRKYPGPAGLLPDDVDLSKLPMAYLSSFDDGENDRVLNESRISDFCSQNTKNLFTGGAWQAMVDDLPPDFLQGLEISTIKHNAGKGLYKIDKVPFMSGIFHNIDSNWVENPMVLLKDSSDQIEASFHLDIFNIYQNSMEPGNVILFKDVGIILSRLYTYALIHPNDIVAIYNEKGRIVTTDFMEKILEQENKRGNGGNREQKSRENLESDLGIDSSFRREERLLRREIENENEERSREIQHEPETEELMIIAHSGSIENPQPGLSKHRRPATPPNPRPMEDFSEILNDDDDDDDAFMSINMEEITASQALKHFASSTLIGSQITLDEKKNSPQKSKEGLEERNKTPVKERCHLRKETPKKSLNVKDYLKQFRNKDDLTQPLVNVNDEEIRERNKRFERIDDENEEGNQPETSNFADLLGSDDDFVKEISMDEDFVLEKDGEPRKESNQNRRENPEGGEKSKQHDFEDPVDEMLSQIDMDAFNVDE